ncbi:MAG: pyrimidine dimer DNA glycosylase/endonuclease V [Candidatus Paceibacterota bacterium]
MRIWDVNPKYLCPKHLLGEHRELHAIWTILTKNKSGYAKHPETLRWKGKLKALFVRHELLDREMARRGYNHNSPLDKKLAKGRATQDCFLHTIKQQKLILKNKPCKCPLG